VTGLRIEGFSNTGLLHGAQMVWVLAGRQVGRQGRQARQAEGWLAGKAGR